MTIERHDGAHILRGTADSLRVSLYVDGVLTDPLTDALTVTITRLDGTALATAQAATRVSAGIYSYPLTAAQTSTLDRLTAVWSGTLNGAAQSVTTHAEIVGDQLFTLGEARAFDGAAMSATATYSNEAILEARDRITDEFGNVLGFSLIPRIDMAIVDGDDYQFLGLPALFVTAVRSIGTRASGGVVYVAFDADELADTFVLNDGRILRESLGYFPRGRRNVRVIYEHGRTGNYTGRDQLRLAALTVLRAQLVPSNLTDRAFEMRDETGSYRLSTPGRHYPFGIPFVDATLERNQAHALAVA